MALTEYESRKDALETLRPLITAEEQRSTNLNTRAAALISAGSVVTAIAAFFSKNVLEGTALDKLGGWEEPAILLLIAAVVALGCTIILAVWTLLPRTHYFMRPDDLAKWKVEIVQDGELIRKQTLRDLAEILDNLREFNSQKVNRLKATYFTYAIAVIAIAIDACIFFGAAL